LGIGSIRKSPVDIIPNVRYSQLIPNERYSSEFRAEETALARDGKVDLDNYPNVLAWIDRIKQLPGFVGMAGISESIAA
jgi:glutathione S-transferase